MFGVFVFMAVLGWLFVAVFLFSAADFDLDVDVDSDVDVDLGADVDIDADVDGGIDFSGNALHLLGALFSFRSLVFFAAFFGLTGVLLTWLDSNTVLALILAIAIGFFAAFINVKLMDYLKRTSINSQLKDKKIAGNTGKIVVPIAAGRRGKVSIDINGQRLSLTAMPYNERHDQEFEVGATVVVVEVKNGSALVTAMDELN
jgi:membrane protein implicated in regulation of membrane protease activity